MGKLIVFNVLYFLQAR